MFAKLPVTGMGLLWTSLAQRPKNSKLSCKVWTRRQEPSFKGFPSKCGQRENGSRKELPERRLFGFLCLGNIRWALTNFTDSALIASLISSASFRTFSSCPMRPFLRAVSSSDPPAPK